MADRDDIGTGKTGGWEGHPRRIEPGDLRSQKWFGRPDKNGHTSRERIRQVGFDRADFAGKPVIGILSTWSELNPCHIHFRDRAADVKRGVWQAGGFPLEVPVLSLGEPFMKPTTMLYRDLLSIEVEEVLRCHPIDGAVLMAGCDKTTPAMLMGALSADLPAVMLPAGPMLTGRWRGGTIGSGTDAGKAFDGLKAGTITPDQIAEMEAAGARSPGHCMTMGTASTMTSLAETMGMVPSGSASIPAPDSRHAAMAGALGRLAVDLVWQDKRPAEFMTAAAFHNAIVALMALGGSSNAVIHLMALADRAGVDLELDDFDRLSKDVPVLANIRPSGAYLMEDFCYAGGLRALLSNVAGHLKAEALTVTGRTLGEEIAGAECFNEDVIRPTGNPVNRGGGLVILRGSLCPDGAVLKRSAASAHLLSHRGRAVVFKDRDDLNARIDDPDLDVTEDSVLVLQNAGPRAVGMPEWGMFPIPAKIAKTGVTDMVRISDARMSGTHYGTVVLHVAPEAAVGGPLALVRDGDWIALDTDQRTLSLEVDAHELERRKTQWSPPEPVDRRGWPALYRRHVTSASQGAALDFLTGADRRKDPPT